MKKNKNNLFVFILISLLALFTVDYSSLLKSEDVATANWSSNYASSFASGSGTESSPYIIKTPAQLARMIYVINVSSSYSNYISDYFYLSNNINMNEYQWVAIGTSSRIFKGFFDGGGNAIYNLRYKNTTSKTENFGLFGYTENATIKNLFLLDSSFEISNSSEYIGGIVGNSTNTTFVNISATVSISGTGNYVGGIVGYGTGSMNYVNSNSNISLSATSSVVGGIGGSFSGNTVYVYNNGNISAGSTIGGLFGGFSTGLVSTNRLKQSYNSGNITGNGNNTTSIGGIVGFAVGAQANTTIIEKVTNSGNVTVTTSGIGIAGIVGQGEYIKITNVVNSGTITATQNYTVAIAGILGICMETNYELDMVTNTGTINGDDFVAGIMGSDGTPDYTGAFVPVYGKVIRAFNSGNVSANNSYGNAAGIISWVSLDVSNETLSITRSGNTGNISGYSASGIVGYAATASTDTYLTISENYNKGNISGLQYVGGIVGYWKGHSILNGKDSIYYSPRGVIEKNYNISQIKVSLSYAGGIIAYHPDWDDSGIITIKNNYSVATYTNLSSNSGYIGGIMGGYSEYKISLLNNYYLTGTSYDGYPAGGIGDAGSYYNALTHAWDRDTRYTAPVQNYETSKFLTNLDSQGFDAETSTITNNGYPILTNGIYSPITAVLDSEFSTNPEINNGNPFLNYFYWNT